MSGGMDWLRWHHGTVTDPRFGLVARKSGASLPDVIAVWAYLLERASASIDRGNFGEIDHESIDCLFDFPTTETRTQDIITVLTGRGMIGNGRIAEWEALQAKREREDTGAAERKRKQREKEALLSQEIEMSRHVTPCHAENIDVTPRGEERREEENIKTLESKTNTPRKKRDESLFDARKWLIEKGATEQHADDWLKVRKSKGSANTLTAFERIEREAGIAGMTIDQVAERAAAMNWRGFEASWVLERAQRPGHGPPQRQVSAFEQRKADEREFMRLKSFDDDWGNDGQRIIDIN